MDRRLAGSTCNQMACKDCRRLRWVNNTKRGGRTFLCVHSIYPRHLFFFCLQASILFEWHGERKPQVQIHKLHSENAKWDRGLVKYTPNVQARARFTVCFALPPAHLVLRGARGPRPQLPLRLAPPAQRHGAGAGGGRTAGPRPGARGTADPPGGHRRPGRRRQGWHCGEGEGGPSGRRVAIGRGK